MALTVPGEDDLQVCVRCGQEKPVSQFRVWVRKDRGGKEYRSRQCRRCDNDRVDELNATDPKRMRSRKSTYLKRDFGITIEDYERVLEEQGGVCGICGTDKPGPKRVKFFTVDHDHETGEVRGLLCMSCNTKLGWFEKYVGAVLAYMARRVRDGAHSSR